MNLFNFLKSVSGKIQLTMVNTSAMALVVGGLASATIYNAASTEAKKELAVRSLSSISSESAYEGLQRRNGLLTSINVKDGLNQVATAEERAALDAGGSSNNFGLDNADRVQNISFGSAAQTSVTDGLGMGGNKAVFSGPVGSAPAGGTAPAVRPGVVAGAAGGASGAAGGERPSLGTASMARASGNAFNAAAGSVGGGSTAPGARGASTRSSSGSGEGYQLSGAMPSGTNAVSSLGLSGGARGDSSFMAGGRHSTTGRGARSFREKTDLKDISKRSADAAGNRNRAANEGSRAFLASARNSGGMTVDGGVEVGETGSADFKAPEASRLKAVGNWTEATDDTAQRRDKARKTLTWLLLGTIAATALAIPFAYGLISAGKALGLAGIWKMIAGFSILAAAAGTATAMIVKAAQYAAEFSGGFLSTIAGVLGGISIACLTLTGVAAMTGQGSPLGKFMEKIMPGMKKAVLKQGKNLAVGAGTSMAKDALASEIKKS